MSIEAKIIADSISEHGVRITTMQLVYPRFIHSEFMTHRVFSRNASSSRAIPVLKMLKDVWNDPAMPIHWGAAQRGMQARSELTGLSLKASKAVWRAAGRAACVFGWTFMKLGLHKQVANRILEPWQHIHVVVTATEWGNFFELRNHSDAQPEIRALAINMRDAMAESAPTLRYSDSALNSWHLPYVSDAERSSNPISNLLKMSAARCARVSYLTHDQKEPVIAKDIALYDALVGSTPLHASPIEHQACPICSFDSSNSSGNFKGWAQYRKQVEKSFINNAASNLAI